MPLEPAVTATVNYLDDLDIVLTPGLAEGTAIKLNGVPLKGVTRLTIDGAVERHQSDPVDAVKAPLVVTLELQGTLVRAKAAPDFLEIFSHPMAAAERDETIDPQQDPALRAIHDDLGRKLLNGIRTPEEVAQYYHDHPQEWLTAVSAVNTSDYIKFTDTYEFTASCQDGVVDTGMKLVQELSQDKE